jgi:transaldolase
MRVALSAGQSQAGGMPNVSKAPQTADRELVREEFRRVRRTAARKRAPTASAASRWKGVAELGQSVWYDNVARPALETGLLERLIAEDHVTGGTSNPSIFSKAVLESDLYDDEIAGAPSDWSAEQVFERCAVADVQRAADLLRPVWKRTRGADGYVSIEEEASVAFDEKLAVRRGHELKALVDRPNVMIKVPGTSAGVAAFRRLTREGVSVNVTLLFSRQRYREVAEAYVEAISERAAAGEDLAAIASVASFFVSRIDAKVDGLLDEGSPLRGTIAIANAKLAYADVFEPTFSAHRWRQLRSAGANVQRPLWASTGTKDPTYRPTLYIEELIGSQTVTTVPDLTIDAFRTEGAVAATLTAGVQKAREDLAGLAGRGVDLDEITDVLEREGVQQFARASEDMIAAIEQTRARM